MKNSKHSQPYVLVHLLAPLFIGIVFLLFTAQTADGAGGLGVFDHSGAIPELLPEGYTLIYELEIPLQGGFNESGILYNLDKRFCAGKFDRVAYYMELDGEWVYVSMDAFTDDLAKIGVPSNGINGSKTSFQENVYHMNIFSNKEDITTGHHIEGNIEFWPNNYGPRNAAHVPHASDTTWDIGDEKADQLGYGSMQIHNHTADVNQTLIAYNGWGNKHQQSDVGLGNAPSGSQPDWTFSKNTGQFGSRKLQILVRPLTHSVFNKVPEAKEFNLIYSLAIPSGVSHFNQNEVPYAIDASGVIELGPHRQVTRLAYYMELGSEWVYVSMDPFTKDLTKIGVPSNGPNGSKMAFQTNVSNMNIFSNKEDIMTGEGIEGNIEFWPNNYGPQNAAHVPRASDTSFDTGDQNAGQPGYGSMQIHNHSAGANQTLIAYNGWGSSPKSDVGLGNAPTGQPDWTFAQNATAHSVKNLVVLAKIEETPRKKQAYLLIGQSNMVGSDGLDPDIDQVPHPRVNMLGYEDHLITLPSGEVEHIQFNSFSKAVAPMHNAFAGVGLGDTFGRAMADADPTVTVGLIPLGISSASIKMFRKDAIGIPFCFTVTPDNRRWLNTYEWFINRSREAQLEGYEIKGILFHQGETDSGQQYWVDDLKQLMADLKKDLGLGDIPILIGQLGQFTPYLRRHNPLVDEAASEITNAHVISSAGLIDKGDDLHFDRTSYRTFGRRYAAKMKKFIGLDLP